MKQLSFLGLVLWISACASTGKHEEQPIATTATGTVTVMNTSTATTTGTALEASTTASTSMATATAVAGSPKPAQDVIAGQVVGEEPMMEVSKHANVRLLQGGNELANITADPQGTFRFEGTFLKGRYEISVRDGKLHGAREISFGGGEITGLNVVVTDGKGDHHHRRRRKRH